LLNFFFGFYYHQKIVFSAHHQNTLEEAGTMSLQQVTLEAVSA
jgi:hypothetical protein